MKVPAPAAAVIAKTDAAFDLHPRAAGALIMLGGALLLISALPQSPPAPRADR